MEAVYTYKYLGLWLDNKLDWTFIRLSVQEGTEQDVLPEETDPGIEEGCNH